MTKPKTYGREPTYEGLVKRMLAFDQREVKNTRDLGTRISEMSEIRRDIFCNYDKLYGKYGVDGIKKLEGRLSLMWDLLQDKVQLLTLKD